jgi:hypothetical protein
MVPESPPAWRSSLTRKILITAGTGAAAFVGSALLDQVLDASLPEQLILTVVIGGVALLTQFLVDFEQRLQGVEKAQGSLARRYETTSGSIAAGVELAFRQVSEANEFFARVESSKLPASLITRLVQYTSRIDTEGGHAIRGLAENEITRMVETLESLSDGREMIYHGEDREWLLSLARRSRVSILATSLATDDSGAGSFEDGLWNRDLGVRYLDLQQDAMTDHPGMVVRRIFVFDGPYLQQDPRFVSTWRLHASKGVDVRVLERDEVPNHLRGLITDFVVFDENVIYEIGPTNRLRGEGEPSTVITRLVTNPSQASRRVREFNQLWDIARPLSGIPSAKAPDRPNPRIV